MTLRRIFRGLALAVALFLVVSPALFFFVWRLSLSLKPEIDNSTYPPILTPETFAWENYAAVFNSNRFLKARPPRHALAVDRDHFVLTVPIVIWIMIGYFETTPMELGRRR